ncbi:hypothetical protein CC86DRAFT_388762 [Ophiobolus disseminans]|uniref:Uncharacterized protein n=1 Tax=Ophiobolus disseminans TaxID=1469910 RepID=A0A6A6ZCB9_9PLEO|nr:hypothetical protein CC86DRAFT_388762 [Ophiobolus disseminans]
MPGLRTHPGGDSHAGLPGGPNRSDNQATGANAAPAGGSGQAFGSNTVDPMAPVLDRWGIVLSYVPIQPAPPRPAEREVQADATITAESSRDSSQTVQGNAACGRANSGTSSGSAA